MEIQILQLLEGAKQARGLTVIIDVFRAFSTECYLMAQGAKEIIAVADINSAYDLKVKNPEIILLGELDEKKPEGFNYGNSPTHILDKDFTGKTIVHRTSSGTQGLTNAALADEILTGSFVNAQAIARYIKLKSPAVVSLVCMGYATLYPTEEDTFCAEYIKSCITESYFDVKSMIEVIKNTSGARLFKQENQEHSPESDFYLCTEIGKFNFVLKAITGADGLIRIKKIDC